MTIVSAMSPLLEELDLVGLVYVSDGEPGIRRIRRGRGFCYKLPDGVLLKNPEMLKRITSLGLPPAYRDVWICLDPRGHLQATGFDQRGRKQYRYHPDWQNWRSQLKFQDLAAFAEVLPRMRRQIDRDLADPKDDPTFLLAALAALLDASHIRVGNQSYARENQTYGATTLLKRHLSFGEDGILLKFTAKGGKKVHRRLKHPKLQRILEEIADLPGRELFSYVDEHGALHRIDSGRLNAYLGDIAGQPVSAKTFRTWGGTLAGFRAAFSALRQERVPTIKDICTAAAEALHNTPAICRTSYVHPHVLALSEVKDADKRRAVVEHLEAVKPKSEQKADEARLALYLADATQLLDIPA
ncbi:DNA topoisomerase IB [Rhizobium paknamense]|uniref:DNA topoisomerase n=1 Tax=Rhizobium paknamense TaxID=1206817 RepID=A0ABU0IBH7_9HYPH|nr:DNA topoisomerase IB [Rhizobium paknamense]MDQ0455583.1 DNA topoisomerase-1 [Rhizobium paknamense]